MSPNLNRIVLSFTVAVACAIGGIDGAEAQRAPSKAPAAKGAQPANDTDRALDGAAKALDAGNVDGAMTSLDSILSAGGLSNTHMARALYLRGLANRKKGRPAQAIADLTNAVWLKDGLGETDRAAALAARGEISREVGVGGAPAASPDAPRTRVASAPRSGDDYPSEPSSSGSGSSGFGLSGITSLFSSSPSEPAPAPAPSPEPRRAAAPPSAPATSSWQSATTVDNKERRRAPQQESVVSDAPPPPPAYSPAPAAPAPSRSATAPQSSGGGLGSFITGLFTGGAPSSGSPSSQSQGGGNPQWRQPEQRVAAAEAPPAVARTAPSVAPKASSRSAESKAGKDHSPITTSAIPAGAYRLQIATVRSRKEADTVAVRVRKEHVGAVGNRVLEVDETVFGGMGTFYRVRLGPFADVGEPQALCNQLRPQGYDCLVVTN